MSLFNRRAWTIVLCAIFLNGCGFQPLYGEKWNEKGVAQLATIKINQIAGRRGQLLRNKLLDSFTPRGQPKKPAYILEVTLTESKQLFGLRKDETATRAVININASFRLVEAGTYKELYKAQAVATGRFDILENNYATLKAEEDSRDNALRVMANDIRAHLSFYFERMKALPPAPAAPAAPEKTPTPAGQVPGPIPPPPYHGTPSGSFGP